MVRYTLYLTFSAAIDDLFEKYWILKFWNQPEWKNLVDTTLNSFTMVEEILNFEVLKSANMKEFSWYYSWILSPWSKKFWILKLGVWSLWEKFMSNAFLLRPDRQSVLTNVRPTKLDKNSGDIRGPTDRWVLKGYLWADYERIMRRLWETEGHTVSRLLCLASNRNKNNKYIVCPPLASLRQDKKGA